MIPVRLAFYAAYIVLGAVIIVRLAAVGLRWEIVPGLVFGAALIALGTYRIATYLRMHAQQ